MSGTELDHPAESGAPPLWLALIPLLVLFAFLGFNVAVYGDDSTSGANQIALLAAAALAAGLAILRGTTWKVIETGIVDCIRVATPAVLVLLLVGALSGTWLLSGVIPTMIYFGLLILQPEIFLAAACIIASVVAVVVGSSWTTSATIGIALMGIGQALGFNPALVAGAVISGAYFGDKLSPLSDTTNLAAGVANVELFTHIRYLTHTTVPSIAIALVLFGVLGYSSEGFDRSDLDAMLYTLENTLHISGWLLLVPAAVVVLIARRVPAIPSIFLGALLGGVAAAIVQPELVGKFADPASNYPLYLGVLQSVYGDIAIATGHPVLDDLLTSGGMAGMLNTVWLIVSAMVFGGAMESSRFLQTITSALVLRVRSFVGLVGATGGTCVLTNLSASDQYLSVVVPGRMYAEAFRDRDIPPENLSRTLEDTGTVTSVLVPWNTCGAYHATVLGVATLSYAPFAFFCLLSPLMTLLVAATGYRVRRQLAPAVA